MHSVGDSRAVPTRPQPENALKVFYFVTSPFCTRMPSIRSTRAGSILVMNSALRISEICALGSRGLRHLGVRFQSQRGAPVRRLGRSSRPGLRFTGHESSTRGESVLSFVGSISHRPTRSRRCPRSPGGGCWRAPIGRSAETRRQAEQRSQATPPSARTSR